MSRTNVRQYEITAQTGGRFVVPQFLKFCTVGILNTLIDISLYYLITRSFWASGFLAIPKAISYLAATFCSFTVNRYWTFGKREAPRLREVGRFYSTVGLGIFVNVGVLYAAVTYFGMHDILAALFAAFATAVWGFSFSKWYVFKK